MNEEQIERYSRNIILKEVGSNGQKILLQSKVLIIGVGGLGTPVALYLAAAGVGTIGIVDFDVVNLSNLQRQVIHFTEDVGIPKVESAKAKINRLNPGVEVKIHQVRVSASNIQEIIAGYDFIVDGTDNFATKFLINDACVLQKKSYSHAGILRFRGHTITILPGESACYRCLFIAPPPACAVLSNGETGVLGGMTGIIGTIQAVEVLKYLLGMGDLLANRLLVFEALPMRFREVKVKRNPTCPVCGENPTITFPFDYEQKECVSIK